MQDWNSKAQKFALFYSIIFLSHPTIYGEELNWDLKTCSSYLSWDNFAARIQKMETSGLLIDRLRLEAMFTKIKGFRSNFKKAQMFTNFRHRNSTIWSAQQRKEATMLYASIGQHCQQSKFAKEGNDELLLNRMITTVFGKKAIKQAQATLNHCKTQVRVTKSLLQNTIPPTPESTNNTPLSCHFLLESDNV